MFPVLFQIGPITFKTLGIFLAFAFLASSFVMINHAVQKKLNLDFLSDHLFSFLLGTLLISRCFFVIENWYKYTNDFWGIFKIQDGGFSFWGGFIGLTAILAFWSYRQKISFWKWFDVIILAAMPGLMLAYIGFFFSGDYYGTPTDLPWAVTFDNPEVRFTDPVHPTQFYAAVLTFLIFIFLTVLNGKKRKEGIVALIGILLFALSSSILNFFLGDRFTLVSELTVFQIMGALIFVVSIVILVMFSQKKYKTNLQ